MTLSELLKKDNNNLDLFRLMAAAMVIYGHAYAIAPQAGHTDVVLRWLGHDYSGSLAVKLFFFLSGLVVTNSLLDKKDAVQFVVARFFRIVPGLAWVVLCSALVLGPLATTLPADQYWASPQVMAYVWDNVRLQTNYVLPDVFAANPHPAAVNGSLWTLPYEVGAYMGLMAVFLVGVFRQRWLVCLVFVLVVLDPVLGNKLLFTWRPEHREVDYLLPCFAVGGLLAYFKNDISVDVKLVLGWLLLAVAFRPHAYGFLVFYVAVFLTMVWVSGQSWFVRLKPSSDLSYGVYLWGFPVQQALVYWWPEAGLRVNQVAALVLSLACAWVSWHVVERRGMALGQRVLRMVQH
jgi:peptidoglycan/LPS O-acetylase OafA/YrhL